MPYGPADFTAKPASRAGLAVRRATPADAEALVAHFLALDAEDRWMRFCATLNPEAIRAHVASLWGRDGLILAAGEAPAGPIRALAELMMAGEEAELGISVEPSLRRRGIATNLLRTGATLLEPRGVKVIRATTMPDNNSFIAMAQGLGGSIAPGPGVIEVAFDAASLRKAP